MTHTLIGYARCSTDKQDLAAQHNALLELGVTVDRIYTDKGFTGTNRDRPTARLGDSLSHLARQHDQYKCLGEKHISLSAYMFDRAGKAATGACRAELTRAAK